MAEPLFTKCDVEFVPVVDFNFIDVCEIPRLPPPIFDCGAPLCPPTEPPPFCPQIAGGDAKITVTSVPAGCPDTPSPSGTLLVTPSGTCEFNISLSLDIPIIEPPCPKLNAGEVTVNANYGSCAASSGTLTIDPTPKENPCENGACEFDIALDLNVNIPPPPCPTISVSSKADDKASGISGTGEVTPGKCDTPNCDITIELKHPPILTTTEITTITNTTLINNFGPTLNTYLSVNTNLQTFIDIVGPTIITYIDTQTSSGNGLCVPKFKAGKIETCTAAEPSADITIQSENQRTHCCYPASVACEFAAGTDGAKLFNGGAATTVAYGTDGASGTFTLDDFHCQSLGGTKKLGAELSLDIGDMAAADQITYCNNLNGRINSGPCGGQSKCPAMTIGGKICFPEPPCVPKYLGGDIQVSLSADPDAEPKGEIKISGPTKYRSCFFPTPSDGFAFWGRSCIPLTEIAAAGETPFKFCSDYGGTLQTSEDCSVNCAEKEISATLTLPDSLCDIKFKKGIGNLQHYDCGGDDPYVTIQVAIDKSTAAGAKSNEYEISISGTFCSCCGTKAEVEKPK